jgi:hypothetical protein
MWRSTVRKFILGFIIAPRPVAIAVALSFVAASVTPAAAQQSTSAQCRPSGPLVEVSGLAEASGLALSRRVPGRLWAHNDSGDPMLFALDEKGAVAAQVRVTGARVEDWEAIAVGPCGSGSCIYIGDIGDNEANRSRITVYRVPEPDAKSNTAAVADALHATYPDGKHDAEALLVDASGRLHIVTKGETGPIGVYRFPAQLQPGATMKLERVGATASKAEAESRVTDGAVSPDGQWAVLRTRTRLTFYRAADLFGGQWRTATTVDLTPLGEAQGEGVALGSGNAVFLAGEGGGKGQPGTFVRFTCAPRG